MVYNEQLVAERIAEIHFNTPAVELFLFPLERKDVVLTTLKKCSRANRSPGSDGQAPGPSAWLPPKRAWSGIPHIIPCVNDTPIRYVPLSRY